MRCELLTNQKKITVLYLLNADCVENIVFSTEKKNLSGFVSDWKISLKKR